MFIELQRTVSSDKRMIDKIKLYEKMHQGEMWKELSWQEKEKVFPLVVVISPKRYNIMSKSVKIRQFKSIREMERLNPQQPIKVVIK